MFALSWNAILWSRSIFLYSNCALRSFQASPRDSAIAAYTCNKETRVLENVGHDHATRKQEEFRSQGTSPQRECQIFDILRSYNRSLCTSDTQRLKDTLTSWYDLFCVERSSARANSSVTSFCLSCNKRTKNVNFQCFEWLNSNEQQTRENELSTITALHCVRAVCVVSARATSSITRNSNIQTSTGLHVVAEGHAVGFRRTTLDTGGTKCGEIPNFWHGMKAFCR